MGQPRLTGRWVGLLLASTTMAGAFIFVPQRGGTGARWSVAAAFEPGSLPLVSDLDGNVYVTTAQEVRALSGDDGRVLWTYSAPERYVFDRPPVVGSEMVIAVATHDGVPADRLLAGLAIRPSRPGPAQPRWTQRRLDMPSGGLHIPLSEDPEEGDFGYAALLSGDQLTLLDLRTGDTVLKREVGMLSTSPVWLPRVGFVPVAGTCRVTAVQFRRDPTALQMETVTLPEETLIRDLSFDSVAGQLMIRGAQRAWSARFVLVPARGGAFQGVGQVGRAPSSVASDGYWNAVLEQGEVAVSAAKTGAVAWSFAPPEGWQVESPMIVADDRVVLVLRAAMGQRAELRAFEAKSGRELWQRPAPGLPAGGWQLAPEDETAFGPARLAVLSQRALNVLNLATGDELARRDLGTFVGVPLWCEGSGFIATTDGYREEQTGATAPAVVAFDINAAGRSDDPSAHWLWRLPADEQIERLEWLPRSRTVIARGQQGIYAFN